LVDFFTRWLKILIANAISGLNTVAIYNKEKSNNSAELFGNLFLLSALELVKLVSIGVDAGFDSSRLHSSTILTIFPFWLNKNDSSASRSIWISRNS